MSRDASTDDDADPPEDPRRVRPVPRLAEVTVADPVLLAMDEQRRATVVGALAELLASDLDRPDL